MARPEKEPEDRRTSIFKICLTAEERELLERVAKGKPSSWAREILLSAAKRRLK
jgi:hypothetical protein